MNKIQILTILMWIVVLILNFKILYYQNKTKGYLDQMEIINSCRELGYDTGFYLDENDKKTGVCGYLNEEGIGPINN